MRNTFLKRAVGVALALTMPLSAIPLSPRAVATSDSGNETFTNPVMYADVPDVDVIRVDDAYYMVSTTMHLSPGCPVMKSTDLVNWETVSYTYDILDDGDKFALRNGESDYGSGSWAASIRHYNGKYYVSFASLSTGKTYIFSTTDVENGTWHRSEFNGYLHDVSLLTTQDDGMYVVYGSGTARCRPVYEDEHGDITLGDEVTLIEYTGLDNDGNPVNGPVSYISEGIHAYEIGDYYYLFMIQWPTGGRRQEVCWRASSLDGPWENRKVLDSGLEFDGQMDNAGVAQGGIVQAADGSWYAMLFQDHGSVGRIPVLVPVTWEDGWPVFGDGNGQAPVVMDLPGTYTGDKDIVVSDEFHNGQPHSFAASNGSVSTTADTATQNVAAAEAQPTADQEAERMDLIVNGSFEDGNTVLLVSDRTNTASGPKQVLTGQLSQGQKVQVSAKVKYNDGPASKTFNFCIQCGDWRGIDVVGSVTARKGQWATITGTYTIPNDADMSYVGCFIETAWIQIGNTLQMAYTMPHFMGYRFGLFNYATQTTSGYVDFDYFHVSDQGSNGSETVLNASLDDIDDVLGVAYAQVELPVKLDTLPDGDYTKLEASLNIPDDFTVSGVVFDEKNVTGDATYAYDDGRLVLTVSGDNVNYQDNGGTGFATVQLQLTDYTTQNKTVQVRTDYVRVTGGNVSYRVDNAVSNISLVKLDSEALAKIPGYSNPLIDYDFVADPFALEYNGRVYVYMTADQFEYDQNGNIIDNTYSKINSLHVISSADLVNWTDHGFIPVAGPNGVAKWANNSWAPAIAYKQIDGQDQFFLYFCNGGGGIGVLEGDSPVGPFTDPLGHALIDGSTPGTQGVPWIFDPAVMVDDDGTGYLVFGGGIPAGQDLNPKSARIVRLGDDMISLDCEPVMIDAPCMFEDGGIHKANGKYYYTYCSNFSGNHSAVEGYPGYGIICYMVSDDPLGPYEYCGEILQNPSTYFGVGGNNHHAIFNFKGTSYIVYHAQTLGQAMGIEKGYRSTHINEVEYYADGRIVPIQADREGISQLETMSPYQLTAGETIAWQAGIKVEACDQPGEGLSEVNNRAVTDIQNGDWIAVAGLDFGDKGAASFTASIAAQAGGAVELRVDSPDGTVVGTLTVPAGDGTYQTLTCDVTGLTGVHNLFLVFTGDDQSENRMSLDSWQFTEAGESASANKALLQATYDYAVNLDTTGVVQAAVDAFQKALTEAKAVLDNPNATQEQVNTAWDNLLEAIWALGLKQGDKTMLELLIHKAEGMLPNESKFLPDHWQETLWPPVRT